MYVSKESGWCREPSLVFKGHVSAYFNVYFQKKISVADIHLIPRNLELPNWLLRLPRLCTTFSCEAIGVLLRLN